VGGEALVGEEDPSSPQARHGVRPELRAIPAGDLMFSSGI